MKLDISSKEADALLDILFNASIRASDEASDEDASEQERAEAKERHELLDSLAVKVRRTLAKKAKA